MKYLKTFESFDELMKKMKKKTPAEIAELKEKLKKRGGAGDSEADELTDDKYKSKEPQNNEEGEKYEIDEFGQINFKS
jgi:hypothetical protein